MALLEARDVQFRYGRGSRSRQVLRGVSADFSEGELYALVGKSGSGKSTLMSLLAALLLPDSGEILYDGISTAHVDARRYRRSPPSTRTSPSFPC